MKARRTSAWIRHAIQRFEFGVHLAEPEQPRQMYEEETFGRTESRTPGAVPKGRFLEGETELVAKFIVRDGKLFIEKV